MYRPAFFPGALEARESFHERSFCAFKKESKHVCCNDVLCNDGIHIEFVA